MLQLLQAQCKCSLTVHSTLCVSWIALCQSLDSANVTYAPPHTHLSLPLCVSVGLRDMNLLPSVWTIWEHGVSLTCCFLSPLYVVPRSEPPRPLSVRIVNEKDLYSKRWRLMTLGKQVIIIAFHVDHAVLLNPRLETSWKSSACFCVCVPACVCCLCFQFWCSSHLVWIRVGALLVYSNGAKNRYRAHKTQSRLQPTHLCTARWQRGFQSRAWTCPEWQEVWASRTRFEQKSHVRNDTISSDVESEISEEENSRLSSSLCFKLTDKTVFKLHLCVARVCVSQCWCQHSQLYVFNHRHILKLLNQTTCSNTASRSHMASWFDTKREGVR